MDDNDMIEEMFQTGPIVQQSAEASFRAAETHEIRLIPGEIGRHRRPREAAVEATQRFLDSRDPGWREPVDVMPWDRVAQGRAYMEGLIPGWSRNIDRHWDQRDWGNDGGQCFAGWVAQTLEFPRYRPWWRRLFGRLRHPFKGGRS